MPLTWSDILAPDAQNPCHRIRANSPIGPLTIAWKAEKPGDMPICTLPLAQGIPVTGQDLADCQKQVETTLYLLSIELFALTRPD